MDKICQALGIPGLREIGDQSLAGFFFSLGTNVIKLVNVVFGQL